MEKVKKYTDTNFIKELAEILGERFFTCDMLHQDELFDKQDNLSNLLCEYSNNGNKLAIAFTKKLPNVFYTEEA